MAEPEPPTVVVHTPNGSVVAAGRAVAHDIVGGLSTTPTLLLIVILNVCAMAVAGWYLNSLEKLRSKNFDQVLSIISVCVGDYVRRAPLTPEGGIGHQ